MTMVDARSSAPVTAFLAVAISGVYALELVLGGDRVCETYGLTPAHASVETVFSSLFLHDPHSLWHVGGNLAFLLVFGCIVERAIGSLLFLALYVAAGVGGAVLHVLVDPSSTVALVGCSGALFGIMAVAGVLRPRLLGFVVAFAGINIWHALAGGTDEVSFGCHIGGFFVGAAVVGLMFAFGSEALEAA
jgi:membrane associated rhomboid family serine protease